MISGVSNVLGKVLVVLLLFVAAGKLMSMFAEPSGQTVKLSPGDNIQAAVDRSPEGTTFNLRVGVYRMQSIVPKEGDSFVGEPGAILNGAALIKDFKPVGVHWSASIPILTVSTIGKCLKDHLECVQAQDLFLDDVPLRPVGSLDAVVAGTWFLDGNSQKIFLVDDPSGRKVEIGATRYAISGSASKVVLRGLIVEKYANPAQTGAIHAMRDPGPLSHDWVVEDNEVRWNHGGGIRLSQGMQVLRNHIHHNGQIGISGGGQSILADGNEIDHNNYAGYDYNWEAGGTKFALTENLVVRNNQVHDNEGPGLWTDIENVNALYEKNHTWKNKVAGIFHEVSYDAVIRDNLIEDDGFNPAGPSPWFGNGIRIAASSKVEVYGNTVKDCVNGIIIVQAERGSSKRSGRPYLARDNNIHDNIVIGATGTVAGIVANPPYDKIIFTDFNNRFENNSYKLGNPNAKVFQWMGKACTRAEWQQYGHDSNGKW